MLLSLLARAEAEPAAVRLWSFGGGSRCAAQTPPHYVVIGDLTPEDCAALARETKGLDALGGLGPEPEITIFAEAMRAEGVPLENFTPQRIHALTAAPIFPNSPGHGRPARANDLDIYVEWTIAFCLEAGLAEGAPSAESLRQNGPRKDLYFWEVDGRPVSMAAITRESANGGNISLVYTTPAERGRGYGGSITAHLAQEIFSRGKTLAFLYTDLRNPISNRVYAKIGFRPLCDTSAYARAKRPSKT